MQIPHVLRRLVRRPFRFPAPRAAHHAVRAAAHTAAETLEGRILLSLSAQISGAPTVAEGGTYTLNLSASGSDAASINRGISTGATAATRTTTARRASTSPPAAPPK